MWFSCYIWIKRSLLFRRLIVFSGEKMIDYTRFTVSYVVWSFRPYAYNEKDLRTSSKFTNFSLLCISNTGHLSQTFDSSIKLVPFCNLSKTLYREEGAVAKRTISERLNTGSLLPVRPSKRRLSWKTMAGVAGCIAKSRKRNNGRKGEG